MDSPSPSISPQQRSLSKRHLRNYKPLFSSLEELRDKLNELLGKNNFIFIPFINYDNYCFMLYIINVTNTFLEMKKLIYY